jgi:uncharacterized YccA/Bax inhibitor family protein
MSNPALNDNIFKRETAASQRGAFQPGWASPASELPTDLFTGGGQAPAGPTAPVDTMRMGGTMSASAVLLALVVVAGWFGWQAVTVDVVGVQANGREITEVSMPPWLILSWIGGLVLAIVTIFKPKVARITAPLYALAQGLMLGAISHIYEVDFNGIVLQAIGLTIGVFVMMLVLYATGTIKVTDRLRTGIIAATGAVFLVYLVSIVLSFFGVDVPMIHDAGPIGIGFSLLVVGIAAFNLLLDFDFIERGVAMGAPKYMEWFGAFGLMVTLIWLYLEILRLLGKLRSQ